MTATKSISVSDAIIQRHAELAAISFKDHVCTERLNQGMFRSWRCQKPGSWIHGFDVTTTPGHLIVTGDIGELVVSRCEDMIAWARGAIRDPHYFAEKVPHAISTEEWSFEKSLEWINEEIADAESAATKEPIDREFCPRCGRVVAIATDTGKIKSHDYPPGCRMVCPGSGVIASRKHKLLELRKALKSGGINGQMDEHEFCTALYDSDLVDGCDWPNLRVFNSNFLWCREAVSWLLNAIGEGRVTHG